jgi:hypothetical protein
LERNCVGGDDNAPLIGQAPQRGGKRIGDTLACACARLDQQMVACIKGAQDAKGHVKLSLSPLERFA